MATLPNGFVARPPGEADRPAIRALVAACGVADYGTSDQALIEGVEMTWNKPGFSRATDAWTVLAPDGRLAAYAHVGPADRAHLYAHAFVRPDFNGRGIGALLLAHTEERAQTHPADSSAAPGKPATLEQWLGATNHAARELLSGAGYAEVRHIWGMVIALDNTLAPPEPPAGITVHSCQDEADLSRAHAASEEAFRDHWHYEPRSFERFMDDETATERYDPSLWLVALEGDEPAGVARARHCHRPLAARLCRISSARAACGGTGGGRAESDRRDARL